MPANADPQFARRIGSPSAPPIVTPAKLVPASEPGAGARRPQSPLVTPAKSWGLGPPNSQPSREHSTRNLVRTDPELADLLAAAPQLCLVLRRLCRMPGIRPPDHLSSFLRNVPRHASQQQAPEAQSGGSADRTIRRPKPRLRPNQRRRKPAMPTSSRTVTIIETTRSPSPPRSTDDGRRQRLKADRCRDQPQALPAAPSHQSNPWSQTLR